MAFYLLDKEKNITSNKELSNFKKKLSIKKSGFSGVLDPFASGLLIIATEGDTKFLELFLKSSKTYIGTILFGKETDTLDSDGKVVKEIKNFEINLGKIKKIINKYFIGKIQQTPPSYSNIKINGKRSHALAREGKLIKHKPVKREIYQFDVEKKDKNSITFFIKVSSGTYIRSLAYDLGKKMNIPSVLIELRRIKIGNISIPAKKIKKVKRENIINFDFIKVKRKIMKDVLDGKLINLNQDKIDLVLKDNKFIVWVKKIKGSYKIYKRIK